MNSIINDQNSSIDIIKMPEIISTRTPNQPLTTTTTMEDIAIINTDGTRKRMIIVIYYYFLNLDHVDDISSIIDKKQKSLISVYDNNPSQQQLHPLIGIIGRNQRSEAFIKRLLLSGFPKPILCDINSIEINQNDTSNYVSYETFYQFSPTIVLITENLITNFQDLFPQNKQQLIIDTREIFSRKPSFALSPIPGSYQAFGNLSNWEIENGTQRTGVAVEQFSPLSLIKFIYDLNCFSRGIIFLDQVSYNNQQIKSFRNCLFPFISTLIIFTLCFILSIIEHNHDIYNPIFIYRRASSITASTSITLLALLFLIRPLLDLVEFIYSKISKNPNMNGEFSQIFLSL
jgi:hypothetical protein